MQEYRPLESLPPFDPDSEVVVLSVPDVSSALLALNPRKASGPDGVPNWVLREYADFLADPVCSILNSSFAEQKLPSQWKHADVTPLTKVKPVTVVSKHIRPISLTPSLSKVAEDFVVHAFVAPAILEIVDPNQFGAIPKSSCQHALVSMLHMWAQATDGTGAAVRIVQLDYKKAFDLIDHRTLANKVLSLHIPRGVARWVIDFLIDRSQRVKLSHDCFSEWGPVPSGVPQGTKLGPWLFVLMLNDLRPSDAQTWKYVDDTTLAEVIPKDGVSCIQSAVDSGVRWSRSNKLQLNVDKCKELTIDFKRIRQSFVPISINDKDLDYVTEVKILGLNISNNSLWNDHISDMIKKANKRIYFLILLKRARVPSNDILNFYCTCVRPVLEYCAPVFHHSLPAYLCNDIERVQRRALSVIAPASSYHETLSRFNLCTLKERRSGLCEKLFTSIKLDKEHKLHHFLPEKNLSTYSLRKPRPFKNFKARTNRFKNTFFPAMTIIKIAIFWYLARNSFNDNLFFIFI